jgi:hypothetical protein
MVLPATDVLTTALDPPRAIEPSTAPYNPEVEQNFKIIMVFARD